jgi:acetylornithine deacetylase
MNEIFKAASLSSDVQTLSDEAISLLEHLIATPSFSREEQATAQLLHNHLAGRGVSAQRLGNNIWASNRHFDPAKPSLLLNSHHDTVKPNSGYTRAPFQPYVEDGKLYGLGSNDAGGCLVSLLACFLHFYEREDLRYNLVFAATAEEEISGAGGISSLLPELPAIDCALVGEPTQLHLAVAEKGLLVIDCEVTGQAGHAARDEGDNAIYKALPDIEWFRTFSFPKSSALLGDCRMSVTIISAGTQHNVVPSSCVFTVDIRVNECYTLEEVLEIVSSNVSCSVKSRSLRLRSSHIDEQHPLVQAGLGMGKTVFGSATLSDKALMPFPALKMGPGDSARSHSADEFIYVEEIREGIRTYIELIGKLV